jgi:hypothetical protein
VIVETDSLRETAHKIEKTENKQNIEGNLKRNRTNGREGERIKLKKQIKVE